MSNQSELAEKLQAKSAPEGYKLIREGNGVMIFPEKNKVFYNNVQTLNRDLSISVISEFARMRCREKLQRAEKKRHASKQQADGDQTYVPKEFSDAEIDLKIQENAEEDGIKIFEALAASGLRSVRYYQQIPGVKSILVNDMDPAAVESIKRNVEFNELPSDRVIANEDDATNVMYNHRKPQEQFDVIDLDPYGSASVFLDSAVQSVSNGGLLCVTCTDMAVLSGKSPETCFSRYGSMPNKASYLHEMALRIVLQSIESSANRYQRHIVPIASCSIDFYVRVFVRVFKSPVNVKQAMTKLSYVFQCVQCDSFRLQPLGVASGNTFHAARGPVVNELCDDCGGKHKLAGPIWSAPIHSREVVNRIRDRVESSEGQFPTKDRLHGLLTTVSEEVEDAPLHYTLPSMTKTLHCGNMKMVQMQAALRNAGYKASQTHKVPDAIKTDAPNEVVWDILRCWVKKHPVNAKRQQERGAGPRILSKEPKLEADFSFRKPTLDEKPKALRFPHNPEPNWGPKARAVGNRTSAED